jgi:hypothetical protein
MTVGGGFGLVQPQRRPSVPPGQSYSGCCQPVSTNSVRTRLPDYPNKEVAAKVSVRHLLTHTGGTGDIFGPEFERHRLALQEHRD